jgi:hypothetical protein
MTIIELRRKALEKLQVLAVDEPVHASDSQVVQAKYEALHDILLQDNLIDWVVTDEIPTAYGQVMVAMLAAECVNEFHCPDALKAGLIGEGKYDLPAQLGGPSIAERRLRRLAAPGFNGQPAQPDYF